MNNGLKKPMIYSDIEVLTVRLEKEKEKFCNLLDQASRITRSLHMSKMSRAYKQKPL